MRKLFFKLFGLLIVGASVGGGWLWMDYRAFVETPWSLPEDGWVYEVAPGATVRMIAVDLQRQGILTAPRYLRWHARLTGTANRLKAGEYAFPATVTPDQFLEKIGSGKVVQYSLQVIEGWTFRQMLRAVHAHEKITPTLAGLSDFDIMTRLDAEEPHPEGLFFPDTYSFPKGTTDLEFLRRAYRALKERLNQAWQGRAAGLPYASAYEALIMASIVEKETGVPYERPAIAGVFVRRLQKGMRLQTDPTVIYGLGDHYDGNIRRVDLETVTPYNTYKIKGLPPTPIALPSGDAINAAVHPEPGKALYFVARGDGAHEFSDTLEQHSRAVLKYQVRPNNRATNKPARK
jgi:UPF0755 protein